MDFTVSSSYTKLRSILDSTSNDALPTLASIQNAISRIPPSLPEKGLGNTATAAHLLSDLTPGFNGSKTSANYYGFVTGGVFPIAELADNVVTAFDQNTAVHLPEHGVGTFVEAKALGMLVELLNLGDGWEGKTFTTGATGSNVLGLACGREAVLAKRLNGASIGELGIFTACMKAGVKEIQVLTTMGHSSLYKAASVVGLGRASVKDIPVDKDEPWRINLSALEDSLKQVEDGILSIVAISAGEVNTGMFAIDGILTMQKIRALCDDYGAWLHVDGAFGIFARSLPKTDEFASLIESSAGLELADSITGDGHKMLNVPYDCGFFLTKSLWTLNSVFQNVNAAYLATGISDIPSPHNSGLENSRRFRALPVYAVLLSHGSLGLSEMFARQVRLARGIARFVDAHEDYELLAQPKEGDDTFQKIHIIVIFRAKDDTFNMELVQRINGTRKMFVSGTMWNGKPAVRIAVSTWRVEVEHDLSLVSGVLRELLTR